MTQVRVGMVSVGMVLVGIVRVGMVTCTHRNQIPRLLPLHQKILCRYVRHCPVERTPCRDPRNSYIETKDTQRVKGKVKAKGEENLHRAQRKRTDGFGRL